MAKLHGAYSQDCQTYLGSRDYRAPEVVRLGINRKKTSGDQGGYGKPADMWSLGAPLIHWSGIWHLLKLIFHWCSGGSFTFHLGNSLGYLGIFGEAVAADAFRVPFVRKEWSSMWCSAVRGPSKVRAKLRSRALVISAHQSAWSRYEGFLQWGYPKSWMVYSL